MSLWLILFYHKGTKNTKTHKEKSAIIGIVQYIPVAVITRCFIPAFVNAKQKPEWSAAQSPGSVGISYRVPPPVVVLVRVLEVLEVLPEPPVPVVPVPPPVVGPEVDPVIDVLPPS